MTQKVLVTGATGFIGAAIVRELIRKGYDVGVLSRATSNQKNLEGTRVRLHYGDLLDAASLDNALRGYRYLIHAAAHYKLFNRPANLPYRINVEGTRNLLAAAKNEGVERIVYTSSVTAVGICPERGIGDESMTVDPAHAVGHYKKSKILAEQEVMRWVKKGLPIVIVNPAAPIGPGDVKPTPTGRIVLEYLRGKMFGYLDTGLNVIAVDDVAEGHVAALVQGRIGQRYILGNRNMTLREIFGILENISGIAAPRWKIPYGLALAAGAVSQTISRITGKDPMATVDAVRMSKKKMYFDSSLAVRELGLPQSSVPEAFEKSVRWFYDNGYVK